MSLEVGGKKYTGGSQNSAFKKQKEDYERRQDEADDPVASRVGGGTISRGEAEQMSDTDPVASRVGGGTISRGEARRQIDGFDRTGRAKIVKARPSDTLSQGAAGSPGELAATVSPVEAESRIISREIRPAPNIGWIPDKIEFPVKRFFGGLKEGALSPFEEAKRARAEGYDAPKSSPSQQIGRMLGLTGAVVAAPIASAPGAASAAGTAIAASRPAQAAKAGVDAVKASKAAQTAAESARRAQQTRAYKFLDKIGLTGVGKVTAQGVAGAEATRQAARIMRSEEERGGLSQREYERAFQDALRAAEADRDPGLGGFGRSVAGALNVRFVDTRKFEREVRREFREQGLEGAQLENAVLNAIGEKNRILAIGEAGSMLNIARASESEGRKQVARAFGVAAEKGTTAVKGRSFWELFKITAPQIGKAGTAEGAASVVSQDVLRGGYGDVSLQRTAVGGAIGGVTAGTIGGTIGGLRVDRPATSRVIEWGTYIVDPFEKPGDVLQDITEAAAKRITGKVPARPTIVQTVDPSSILFFDTKPGTKPGKGKGKRPIPLPVLEFASTPVSTPGKPGASVPVLPIDPRIGQPKIPTPVLPIDPRIGQPRIPTPVPPIKPPDPVVPDIIVPADIPVEVPVSVPSQVPVNVGIPTVTPQWRVPPPIPLGFSTGAGRGTGRGRKRRKYVDELAESKRIIDSFLGVPPAIKKPRKTKKRVKAAGRSRVVNDPYGFLPGGRLL